MSSLSEMRAELRALRKDKVKPVSKMKKGDVAAELERLREARETVPPVAATNGAAARKMVPKAENVKKAKAAEMPVKPSAPEKAPKKKGMSKSSLRALLEEMSSSDEE